MTSNQGAEKIAAAKEKANIRVGLDLAHRYHEPVYDISHITSTLDSNNVEKRFVDSVYRYISSRGIQAGKTYWIRRSDFTILIEQTLLPLNESDLERMLLPQVPSSSATN